MYTLYSKQYGPLTHKKPPLVLLHGFLGDSKDWLHIIQHMPQTTSLICIDLPGHGQSSAISVDANDGFRQTCQLIKQTLEQLQITKCVLLGYSLGGRIAVHFAHNYSNVVKALILESANLGLSTEQEKRQRHTADLQWAEFFSRKDPKQTLELWYQQGVFNSLTATKKKQLIDSKISLKKDRIAHMLMATSLSKQDNFCRSLSIKQLPIYYLFGELDTKFKQLASQYVTQFDQLNAIEFNDAGHNIHFDQPLHYANKITQIYSSIIQ